MGAGAMKARGISAALVAALLAGCAHHRAPSPAPVSAPAEEPRPPAGSAPGQTLPEPGADGRYQTINSGLGNEEALWHVRSALNVAALSCAGRPGGGGIVQHYNALLTQRKAVLSTAYTAETARFGSGGQGGLDRHMTQLYNFFAQPPAQGAFCAAAARVADRAAATPPAGLPQFAPQALAELEAPILDYYRAYAAYRRDLAAWKARPVETAAQKGAAPKQAKIEAIASVPRPEPKNVAASSSSWRIQLGAFTGRPAAEAAWEKARTRLPALAAYRPHYQNVPNSPLVRLQVGSASDRAGALQLCATAAAGGFDCLPVDRDVKR